MNSLGLVYHYTEMIFTTLEFINHIADFSNLDENDPSDDICSKRLLQGCLTVSKGTILALNVIESHFLMNPSTLGYWTLIKTIEIVPRVLSIPLEFWHAKEKCRASLISREEKLEKGLALPLCTTMQTVMISNILANEKLFYYAPTNHVYVYFCKEPGPSVMLTLTIGLLRGGFLNNTVQIFEKIFNLMPARTAQSDDPESSKVEVVESVDIEPFQLVKKNFIPDEFAGDLLFKNYICNISFGSARIPVMDPTNNISIYDRKEIKKWLSNNSTSPITRKPLKIGELKSNPKLQQLIDERLQFHQDRILKCIEEGLNIPLTKEQEEILNGPKIKW